MENYYGLYYKHIMIIDDNSRVIRMMLKIVASLYDNSRGVIYNSNMFIVQTTGIEVHKLLTLAH